MLACIEKPLQRYLAYWHGSPEDATRQYQYYRCEVCRGLVTWKQIHNGGCKCGVGSRIRAAHITWFEKVKLLLMPWSV